MEQVVRLLAIETSCDETSVALLEGHGAGCRVMAHEVASQLETHRPYGGVVPELATRRHLQNLPQMVDDIMGGAEGGIGSLDAVAVTRGPGLASSLLVGVAYGKGLALAAGIPWLGINHLEGHIYSPFLAVGAEPVYPHIALIISGGHTLLVHVPAPMEYIKLGGTRDDAVGEAFDKTAKLLGLDYPGGPEVEKMASTGRSDAVAFPRSMIDSGDYAFSFSGLKTAVRVQRQKHPDMPVADVCASFQAAVTDILVSKSRRALAAFRPAAFTISGGVSCNKTLRQALEQMAEEQGVPFHAATGILSTDNAAMIGAAALARLKLGAIDSLELDVDPNLSLFQSS